MKKSGCLFLILLLVALAFIWLVPKIKRTLNQMEQEEKWDLPSSTSLTAGDSVFLSSSILSKIKILKVQNSRVRPPLSFMEISDKYFLTIFQFPIDTSLSLKDILQFKGGSPDRSINVTYAQMEVYGYYSFQNSLLPLVPTSNIILTTNPRLSENGSYDDSTFVGNIDAGTIGIQFGKDSHTDILVTGDEIGFGVRRKIPASLAIVRRKSKGFFAILTPKNSNDRLPFSMLQSLIN